MVRAALRRRDASIFLDFAGVESMADGASDREDRKDPSAEEAALSARLRRLDEQLGQTRTSRPDQTDPEQTVDRTAMARGFRLSTELVGGVLLGAGLGWLLDRWLGISPWGLIVFLLLGFAGGVLNVMRAAGVAPAPGSGDPDPGR
jgi:ATP synthase protein I